MVQAVPSANIEEVNKMYTINARNVNDALFMGVKLMDIKGDPIGSRNGPTLELDAPVATVYERPWERVLINETRDANPFFHLFESLWILAGRQDVKFLSEFNTRMVDYSDDGEVFNAPYGYRIRHGVSIIHDQLTTVINILLEDRNSRQAVCQIWDEADLHTNTKDKACNMSIVFRIRSGKLCMTVYNRSNDMIWGAYGANVVQFSMIQEYVAAHLHIPIGEYTQVSNSFHVYTEGPGGRVWNRMINRYEYASCMPNPYDNVHQMVTITPSDVSEFDEDLISFFRMYDYGDLFTRPNSWKSTYFNCLVERMLQTFLTYKQSGAVAALGKSVIIGGDDWRAATGHWLTKRINP